MPQGGRRLSGGGTPLDTFPQLEEILEHGEEDEDQDLNTSIQDICQAPKEFGCLRGAESYPNDISNAVKLICTNNNCRLSPFMHGDCFQAWEETLINFLNNSGKARLWSDKQQRQNLWSKKGFDLIYKYCPCNCLNGYLRKDMEWQMNGGAGQSSTDSEGEKMKKRKRKISKSGKTTLTIGLPNLGSNNMQMKRSECQGIPAASAASLNRIRTNSVSSTASGSSSFSSMSSPAASPPSESNLPPPRRQNPVDRSRHDSGGSIFLRRSDYSSFNVLPKHKINSYHIKMEDECSIGNDETRCFILSSYASNKMNRVPCVLCSGMMNIFERYPLIDGTFFLSPRQHTKACIQVKVEGKVNYLSAVCMGCLEGWTTTLHCRYCLSLWDGSQLILGTMYSYDIFAAVPCCADRLKCTACNQLVIHPEQRFNFFSDYSQPISCPCCGVQDFHFTRPLNSFLSREELAKVAGPSAQNGGRTWASAVRS